MNLGPFELIVILIIVVLIFGVGRVSRIGSELGQAIRGFREGLSEGDDDKPSSDAPRPASVAPEKTSETPAPAAPSEPPATDKPA